MQPERKIRMITSCYEEALDRIKWLEDVLKEMVNWARLDEETVEFAQSILDGEPTTADEYNESQFDYHDSDQENEYNFEANIEIRK